MRVSEFTMVKINSGSEINVSCDVITFTLIKTSLSQGVSVNYLYFTPPHLALSSVIHPFALSLSIRLCLSLSSMPVSASLSLSLPLSLLSPPALSLPPLSLSRSRSLANSLKPHFACLLKTYFLSYPPPPPPPPSFRFRNNQ